MLTVMAIRWVTISHCKFSNVYMIQDIFVLIQHENWTQYDYCMILLPFILHYGWSFLSQTNASTRTLGHMTWHLESAYADPDLLLNALGLVPVCLHCFQALTSTDGLKRLHMISSCFQTISTQLAFLQVCNSTCVFFCVFFFFFRNIVVRLVDLKTSLKRLNIG